MKSPHVLVNKASPGRDSANKNGSLSPSPRRSPRRSSISPQRSSTSRTNSQSIQSDTVKKQQPSKQLLSPLKPQKTVLKKNRPIEEAGCGLGDEVCVSTKAQKGETVSWLSLYDKYLYFLYFL